MKILFRGTAKSLASTALLFLLVLPAYGQTHDISVDFTPVQSYASEEEGIFLSSSFYTLSVDTDEAGNVYMLDAGSNTLMSFDNQSNLRWRTGTAGRGPGDFERPTGMVYHDGHLLISNQNGSRLDQFDLSGNYQNSYNMDEIGELASIEGVTSSGQLVFSATVWGIIGEKVIVAEIDGNTLKMIHQFTVNHAPDVNLGGGLSSGGDVSVVGSEIIVGNKADYLISFFRPSGTQTRTFTKNPDKIVRPGFKNEGGSRSMQDFGGVLPPTKLTDSYFITTATWPLNVDDPDEIVRGNTLSSSDINYANSLDLFDSDGNLVFTREYEGFYNPDIGSILHVDSEGYLYGRKDEPLPQLTKYRVTILEN